MFTLSHNILHPCFVVFPSASIINSFLILIFFCFKAIVLTCESVDFVATLNFISSYNILNSTRFKRAASPHSHLLFQTESIIFELWESLLLSRRAFLLASWKFFCFWALWYVSCGFYLFPATYTSHYFYFLTWRF